MRFWHAISIAAGSASVLALDDAQYEYVVIGSGAGGGAVAATLARKGHSVFLIEAGANRNDALLEQMPSRNFENAENPEASWQFFVEHFGHNETQARRDPNLTYLLNNGSRYTGISPPQGAKPLGIEYPRGACVGGSTSVNAMNLGIPPDHEWDHLVNVTGDPSYAPHIMRDYFERIEKCNYLPRGTPGHGFDGFITLSRNNVSYLTNSPGIVDQMSKASQIVEGLLPTNTEELTELLLRDPYHPGEYSEGVYMLLTAATENKRRSHIGTYLTETVNAKNKDGSQKYPLTISTNSLASKVLFHQKGKVPEAYGVEYQVGEALYAADQRYDPETKGSLKRVVASREVIVSGGTFNTPQILKLSGVGPRDELERFDIPLVAHVPAVGKHLQDNYEVYMVANASTEFPSNFENCSLTYDNADPCFEEWLNKGAGPYGEASAPVSMIYRTNASDDSQPDIWIYGFPGTAAHGFYPGYSRAPPAPSDWTWVLAQMPGPGSDARGSVTLRSTNPRDVPSIDFNSFAGDAGERDLDALEQAGDLVLRVFNATSRPWFPYTIHHYGLHDAGLRQEIKDQTFGHHASGTCRMGPIGDSGSCVDPQFKVHGVKGLRVVDASVWPRVPGAWPTMPTYILGVKLADILSEEAKKGHIKDSTGRY